MGTIRSNACAVILALFLSVTAPEAFPQTTTAPDAQEVDRLAQALQEARDLEATQLSAVLERLAPLVTELRGLQQQGALTQDTAKIFEDALLLQISTQGKLLAPEADILNSFHELLRVNPRLDDSIFNPREKLLLDKIRSTETGSLSLTTDPIGVPLIYEGAELATTPVDMPLVSGTYRLQLRKEGYREQEMEITIRPSEILVVERIMRRKAVDIPLATNIAGVAVTLNGQPLGTTVPLDNWVASLPPDRRDALRSFVTQWANNAGGFLRIPDVEIGSPVILEFQAPCYQPQKISFTVGDQDVDWTRLVHVQPELRLVELKKDTGFMEVTSTPPGGEVWIDGALAGRTPLQQDICVGTHRIQVLHGAGQYLQEVVVLRDQIAKVAGVLRPALLFAGIYAGGSGRALQASTSDWETVSRQLVLRGTAFVNVQVSQTEIESRRKSGRMPLEELMGENAAAADTLTLIRRIAVENGHVDMLLFGVQDGDRLTFRLYSTLQPVPDMIVVPGADENSISFLVAQLNRADQVPSRLFTPDLGVQLYMSPYGLAVQSASDPKSEAQPGTIVRTVDQRSMTLSEFETYRRSLKPGSSVTMEITTAAGGTSRAVVAVKRRGAEYPWSTPDGFLNSVLTMLHHLVENDPKAEISGYAALSLALGMMRLEEWKLALEFLARADLEPQKAGVCPGTVLYHQGLCHEALGDTANALSCFTRAAGYPGATLATYDGLSVATLAARRIQLLKERAR